MIRGIIERYRIKFMKIIDANFSEPTEDYHMVQFIKWMHHDETLLNDREIDFFADEENMVDHLSSTYGISTEEARRVFHYAEDMYLSGPQGNTNE